MPRGIPKPARPYRITFIYDLFSEDSAGVWFTEKSKEWFSESTILSPAVLLKAEPGRSGVQYIVFYVEVDVPDNELANVDRFAADLGALLAGEPDVKVLYTHPMRRDEV